MAQARPILVERVLSSYRPLLTVFGLLSTSTPISGGSGSGHLFLSRGTRSREVLQISFSCRLSPFSALARVSAGACNLCEIALPQAGAFLLERSTPQRPFIVRGRPATRGYHSKTSAQLYSEVPFAPPGHAQARACVSQKNIPERPSRLGGKAAPSDWSRPPQNAALQVHAQVPIFGGRHCLYDMQLAATASASRKPGPQDSCQLGHLQSQDRARLQTSSQKSWSGSERAASWQSLRTPSTT